MELIEASKAYNDDGCFKLKIVFEDGKTIEKTLNTNLAKEDYFNCVDVTGDGYTEIVFPSLGYKNTVVHIRIQEIDTEESIFESLSTLTAK